jgi:hypothetical protein
MTLANQNLEMYAGDTNNISVSITDHDGAPLNLTGAAIEYKAGASLTKTVGVGITITDAPGGICRIEIDPIDTAALSGYYYHQLVVTNVGGDISTVLTGILTIHKKI